MDTPKTTDAYREALKLCQIFKDSGLPTFKIGIEELQQQIMFYGEKYGGPPSIAMVLEDAGYEWLDIGEVVLAERQRITDSEKYLTYLINKHASLTRPDIRITGGGDNLWEKPDQEFFEIWFYVNGIEHRFSEPQDPEAVDLEIVFRLLNQAVSKTTGTQERFMRFSCYENYYHMFINPEGLRYLQEHRLIHPYPKIEIDI